MIFSFLYFRNFEMCKLIIFVFFCNLIFRISAFPDPGRWSRGYDKVDSPIFGFAKPLYLGSSIYVTVNCEPFITGQRIVLQWLLRQTFCFEDSLNADVYNHPNHTDYFICPISTNYSPQMRFYVSEPVTLDCSNGIQLQFVNMTLVTYNENQSEIPDMCPTITPSKYFRVGNFSGNSQSDPQLKNILYREQRSPIQNSTTSKNKADSKEDALQKSLKSNSSSSSNLLVKKKSDVEKKNEINPNLKSNETSAKQNVDYTTGFLPAPHHVVKPGSKLATVDMDGIYLFILIVKNADNLEPALFNISVDIAMKGDTGYLSAADYPLLPFYGVMCGLYVIYAIAWLVMSALQWRDLLRIQFWIGAVILLGLMEKAVFYAEYQSINYTGQSVQGAILFAEILSCMKRTLARMLIIIVSLGFGIVKPRLGPMLHRIIGVGTLYFCLGAIEGCLRVLKPKTDPGNQALMAGIPLAVTDSAICWWIFSSLVQTIRTLRLRRNIVKLQLYKHFTNTLLLSVIGSVAFMTWSIHAHKLANCITDWKELWVDEAYWHFLFSVILFVIMILWRPTNNNQRYAFTPLLDAMDDEDEDDEENHLANDAFVGMKMRTTKNNSSASPKQDDTKNKQDEDLKWVEENIPTSLTDVALPSLLDSDEEIMTAKFERSKME